MSIAGISLHGGGTITQPPPTIVGLDQTEGSDIESVTALRQQMLGSTFARAECRAVRELNAWFSLQESAEALAIWFGNEIVADRSWLLHALDRDVTTIDALIADQINAILHSRPFQQLESSWRGLVYLTEAATLLVLAKVRVLALSWRELTRDLERASDFDRSQLYAKIYTEEAGTLGGEPFGLLIGDYEIQHHPTAEHTTDDIAVLKSLAMITAAAFAPIVMGASPRLFQLESFSELGRPFDLSAVFRQPDYRRWHSMRAGEETRFVGLALPRTLMRLPYGISATRRDGFRFEETVSGRHGTSYLWGNAAFAFGSVVLRAFANFGWFADIRGAPRDELRGGLVSDLPVACFATDSPGVAKKPSLESVLSDTQEKELADLGFIALRKIPFTDYSVFYANPSIQEPTLYTGELARRNARLSCMLQYMLCISRFAHYIKILGRNCIGTMLTAGECEQFLHSWLLKYCEGSDDAPQQTKARYPLREASVTIKEVPGRAGSYSCTLFLRPHFQLDDIAAGFRLVTRLAPAASQV